LITPVVPDIWTPDYQPQRKGRVGLYKESDIRYAQKHAKESNMQIEGRVRVEHYRDGKCLWDDWEPEPNIVPTVGLNHFLDVVMGAVAKSTTWYVGIFKNNVAPLAGHTATELGSVGSYGECQDADYDLPLTNRPEYIDVAAAAGVMTNTASKAQFTIAATITVYGAAMVDVQAKTSAAGTMLAAKLFTNSRAVIDNDELFVTYQMTATSS
jgi:hypothetical protein